MANGRLTVAQMQARLEFHRLVRQFFCQRDYLEWQTPIVVPMPGTEANLGYFSSPWQDVNGAQREMFLRSSPEIHLKKVIASEDVPRLFELGPCFRNHGELGPWHHPEFMMLEWYRQKASAESMMEETLELVSYLSGQSQSPMSFAKDAVPVLTVAEAFSAFAGLQLVDGDPCLAERAQSEGKVLSVASDDDFETAFFKILLEKVEPALAEWPAVFLCDYPPSQAALATIKDGVAKRFELYINGVEISNGFWELQDAAANRQRIDEANSQRQQQGRAAIPVDEEFIGLLDQRGGLPDCSGTALGVDRLQAVLAGADSIDPVVDFRRSFGAAPGDHV